jgi:hypothetical protein
MKRRTYNEYLANSFSREDLDNAINTAEFEDYVDDGCVRDGFFYDKFIRFLCWNMAEEDEAELGGNISADEEEVSQDELELLKNRFFLDDIARSINGFIHDLELWFSSSAFPEEVRTIGTIYVHNGRFSCVKNEISWQKLVLEDYSWMVDIPADLPFESIDVAFNWLNEWAIVTIHPFERDDNYHLRYKGEILDLAADDDPEKIKLQVAKWEKAADELEEEISGTLCFDESYLNFYLPRGVEVLEWRGFAEKLDFEITPEDLRDTDDPKIKRYDSDMIPSFDYQGVEVFDWREDIPTFTPTSVFESLGL